MDIPVELFLGFIGVSIAIALFGFVRNPQIPACLVMGGMFILTLSIVTTNIIMFNGIDKTENTEPNYAYRVTVGTTASGFLDASSIGKGERLTVNSTMIGKKIQCIGVELSKAGSPTGFAEIGIFSELNSNSLYYKFGQIDVSTLTAVNIFHHFCVEEGFEHTLVARDVIGIKYNGATAVNHPDLRRTTTDVFDTTNTQAVTVATAGAPWTTITTSDFNMVAYDIQTIDNNLYEFTELPKTLFGLIGVMFMLVGGLMVMRD